MTAYRARPYDYRRDGAQGGIEPLKYAGGIFGQPFSPKNHMGIFESRYAIPEYIEQAEQGGGPLFPDTLKADAPQSEPIERGIAAPDLGPPIKELYPQPFKRRRVARKPKRSPALGNDVVTTTVVRETNAPTPRQVLAPLPDAGPVERPGLLQRPVAGPLALIGVGLLIAYVVFR